MEEAKEENVMYTGGAAGADYYFTSAAITAGHHVNVISFAGHRSTLPSHKDSQLSMIEVSPAQFAEAADPTAKAGDKLVRANNGNPYVTKLLRRNYFQINAVKSVYAVGFIMKDSSSRGSVHIARGTAWACQMFVDRMRKAKDSDDIPVLIPLYFFDQTEKRWFQCQLTGCSLDWIEMEENPPTPSGKYAGIGTRDITGEAKAAIANLY